MGRKYVNYIKNHRKGGHSYIQKKITFSNIGPKRNVSPSEWESGSSKRHHLDIGDFEESPATSSQSRKELALGIKNKAGQGEMFIKFSDNTQGNSSWNQYDGSIDYKDDFQSEIPMFNHWDSMKSKSQTLQSVEKSEGKEKENGTRMGKGSGKGPGKVLFPRRLKTII